MSCLPITPGTTYSTSLTPFANPSYLVFSPDNSCLAVINNGIQADETPDINLSGTNSDVAMFKVTSNNSTGLVKVQGPNINGNFGLGARFGIEASYNLDGSCLSV